ncbi:glycosyltransferase family 4 protein [Puerhibacterium puerhi]|uniref:glycosyltransferase family 4 protein n=1 Tax=Puerhibacterium puerhi TaxID=2692623 RepID=UPI0013584ED1|nr:glycosyltransferase family 4 protein [Puerhibacterium puerhi]
MQPAPTATARVLLVTHYYHPERGAPQRRWDALVPRLADAGIEVSVLAPPPHYPHGTLLAGAPASRPGSVTRGRHGERVVRVRYREHSQRLLSRTADQAVAAASSVVQGLRRFGSRAHRPDVVVGTVPGIPSMFAAWVLARLLRARFVVEMRDAWPDLIAPSGIFRSARSPRSRLRVAATAVVHRVLSRLQARADAVVTTTEAFAQVLRERGVERVAVVRNGTAFAPLECTPVPAAERRARPFRAVYAGTIGRAQGLEAVVRAAKRVADAGQPIEVRLVGVGAEVPALQALVDLLDAPVTIEPPVPFDRVRDLYAWADTLVVSLRDWLPLQWTVPSKLYEVMASGVHVTACVAGEAADIVTDVGAGIVVPPGDADALAAAWRELAASPEPVVGDPAAAQWVAENADDDSLADRYARLLSRLATRPTKVRA